MIDDHDSELFLSPTDLAALLGIPVATIYGWRYKGIGPRAFRIGRHLRYRRRDVDLWLEQHADGERRGRV